MRCCCEYWLLGTYQKSLVCFGTSQECRCLVRRVVSLSFTSVSGSILPFNRQPILPWNILIISKTVAG